MIFFDPGPQETYGGIAYGKDVICAECGKVFELGEVEILEEHAEWRNLEPIIGSAATPDRSGESTGMANHATRCYEFLKDKLGEEIVDNEKEFEAWFKRMCWHVKECDRLARKKNPLHKTITALESEFQNIRLLTMQFEVPDKDFDLLEAISLAVSDYAKTPEGKKVLEYNCGYFELTDVESSLPREFCKARGFSVVDSVADEQIDWDYDFGE